MTSQKEKVRISLILFDVFDSVTVFSLKRWKEVSVMFIEYLYVTENFELHSTTVFTCVAYITFFWSTKY